MSIDDISRGQKRKRVSGDSAGRPNDGPQAKREATRSRLMSGRKKLPIWQQQDR